MSDIAGMERKKRVDQEGNDRTYLQSTAEARWIERRHQFRKGFVLVEMPHPYVTGATRSYYVRKEDAEKDPFYELAGEDEMGGEKLPRYREKE